MIASLKAELRKLFSVRSTYVLIGVAFLFVAILSFYAKGYKATGHDLTDPMHIASSVLLAGISVPVLFGTIIAILLMTQEYRYNTIMYTLTASNSRSKVLIGKILAISIFGLTFTAVTCIASVALAYLGVHVHGNSLVSQTIPYGNLIWRCLFYGWTSIVAGLLLATLVRSQIGSVVALFVIPTIEQILSLLLKGNSVYLPFTSSDEVLMKPSIGHISPERAALVFSAYLLVAWAVAWVLFLRRDAN